MTKLFAKLSIRTTLACLIGLMGLIVAALCGQQMWTSYWQHSAAVKAAELAKLDQDLFNALVSARYERASLQTAVIQSLDKNQSSIATYQTRRKEVDAAMAAARETLATTPFPALKSAANTLSARFTDYNALRDAVDRDAKLVPASRDKTLVGKVLSVGDAYLQSLEEAASAAEIEIRALNPRLSELIITRNLAWSVRAAIGTSGQMFSSILAQSRPFDEKEAKALVLAEAQGAFGWSSVKAIANTPQTAPEIRSAIAQADTSYFSGSFKALKDEMTQKLTSGQTVAMSTEKWRETVIPALDSVSDVASAALKALNESAAAAASRASYVLATYSALFIGALLLSGFGFVVVRSRVTGPIADMTDTMRAMAAGDLSIDVPHGSRRDEIGAMAVALTVFKENGLRVRALEEQEREASAKRLHAAESMALIVSDVGEVVAAAAAGDFSARLQIDDADEQMQRLVAGINEINAVVDGATTEFAEILQGIAGGDLTSRVETAYRGRFADLKGAINETVDRLSDTVATIQTTSADVGLAAREINMGADDLSKRTEEQASSLEETAATTEELAASVKASAQASKEAARIADEAMQAAENGGAIAGQAVDAMARIETASQKISDIIRVIDDIAFQTNLLALNAAVEAARAGDAGKGFAVVASEVRTLAQRSSAAAKDISGLISSSNVEVGDGVKLVRQAGDQLARILAASQKVAATIADISAASGEQANGIDEMSQAVAHLDEMTQQNAALSEQSAASANSLSGRIEQLNALVAAFKIRREPAGQAAYAQPAVTAARAVKAPMQPAPAGEPARLRQLAEAAFVQSKAMPAPRKVANGSGRASDSGWEEF